MNSLPKIVDQQGKNAAPIYCSFCGKRDDEVKGMVCGPTVYICNGCVEVCISHLLDSGVEIEILPIGEKA